MKCVLKWQALCWSTVDSGENINYIYIYVKFKVWNAWTVRLPPFKSLVIQICQFYNDSDVRSIVYILFCVKKWMSMFHTYVIFKSPMNKNHILVSFPKSFNFDSFALIVPVFTNVRVSRPFLSNVHLHKHPATSGVISDEWLSDAFWESRCCREPFINPSLRCWDCWR